MNLSEEEIKEIEDTAAIIPVVGKLLCEYRSYQEDVGKMLYKSLYDTCKCLEEELVSVRTGTYSKRRILSSDSKEWKRIFSLLINSKKIMAGLAETKDLVSGDSKVIKKETEITEDDSADDGISLTDKMANQKQK